MVLPDEPGAFGLPTNPQLPLSVTAWQKVVQPFSLAMTGLSIAVTGVAAVIARRNHVQEVKRLHSRTLDSGTVDSSQSDGETVDGEAVDGETGEREERAA